MPRKLYNISLSGKERQMLEKIVRSGTYSAREVLRANILLNSDSSGKHVPVKTRELASLLNTSMTTVQKVRKEYSHSSLKETVYRKKRETPPVPPKVDGTFEAMLIALACQSPPEGYAKWNLRLLADKSVELGYIESISHMTVSRILKKTNLNLI